MAKKSTVMSEQYYKGVQKLPPEERGEAYEAYLEYAFYGKEYEGSNIAIQVLFASIVDSIDAATENYNKKVQKLTKANEERKNRAEERRKNADTARNGFNVSRNTADTARDGSDTLDNTADTYSVTDTVTDTVSKEKGDTNVSPKKKFVRPTLSEVRSFADEHGYTLDVQHFYDYYESNGWRVGRNAMKDWRAAMRNWLKNDFDRGKGQSLPDDDLNAYMAAQAAKERAEDEARGV